MTKQNQSSQNQPPQGSCPICDGDITLPADVQQTELVTCGECGNRLVVDNVVDNGGVKLSTAPPIEEDWGE